MNRLREFAGRRVSIGGKSVSVLTIMAVLFIGTGSATLVTSFGLIEGSADFTEESMTATGTINSYTPNAPPETFANVVTASNNNADESVNFEWAVTQSAQNSGDVTDTRTTIYDVSSTTTQDVDNPEGNTNTVEISYNTSENEVLFEVPAVNDYSNNKGVVFGFDSDNDGEWDFQVDTVASGIQPDYYESVTGSYFDDHYDYNSNADGTSEYEGVFFEDSSTQLQNKNSFVLSVDAERLGSDFAFNVQVDGSGVVKPIDSADTNAVDSSIGTTVSQVATGDSSTSDSSSTLQTVELPSTSSNFDSDREYAVITEFGSQTPVDTYDIDVEAVPN